MRRHGSNVGREIEEKLLPEQISDSFYEKCIEYLKMLGETEEDINFNYNSIRRLLTDDILSPYVLEIFKTEGERNSYKFTSMVANTLNNFDITETSKIIDTMKLNLAYAYRICYDEKIPMGDDTLLNDFNKGLIEISDQETASRCIGEISEIGIT